MIKLASTIGIILLVSSCSPVKTEHIYYWPGSNEWENPKWFNETSRVPYTLNHCTRECVTRYIPEEFYSDYKKQYDDLGVNFPYPPIVKTAKVILPKRY